MRWSQFESEINELHEKTKPLLVEEEMLTETMKVLNSSNKECIIKIVLSDNVEYWLDDSSSQWNVKQFYSAADKAWLRLLGSLKTKVEMAEALHKKLVDVLVQPYVKEAVMDRLTSGSDDIPDNETIIANSAKRRWEKLNKMVPRFYNSSGEFHIKINDNFNIVVVIHQWNNPGEIQLSGLSFNTVFKKTNTETLPIKKLWNFLSHYEEVEHKLQEFITDFNILTGVID